jgi:L-threonylcarbamoyladenylate synthase
MDPRLISDGRIAVRLPGASDAACLAAAFGATLTATSANASGAPPLMTGEQVQAAFSGQTGLVVLPGIAPGGQPSTIVAFEGDRCVLLRPGAISIADLERG